VQLYCYFVSQSSEFCRHNPLCRFSTNVYCCCLFRYRLSPKSFGYTLVWRTTCWYQIHPFVKIIWGGGCGVRRGKTRTQGHKPLKQREEDHKLISIANPVRDVYESVRGLLRRSTKYFIQGASCTAEIQTGVFQMQVTRRYMWQLLIRGCIQKFPDWVDTEINNNNNNHSLRRNTKCYGGKTL
jgi:hypothetical protein